MAEEAELELESENDATTGSSSQSVRKHIAIKLKPLRSRSKGRKGKNKDKQEELNSREAEMENIGDHSVKVLGASECMNHNQPMQWKHKVSLIGTKVVDPMIHCCEKCSLPILSYGRMIPCKHVFCSDCAKKTENKCPRCDESVQRIEQSALGSVFVCTYGGTKHGVSGCRRTYLSERDLQAHISHRHLKTTVSDQPKSQTGSTQPPQQQQQPPQQQQQQHQQPPPPVQPHPPPPVPPPPPQNYTPAPQLSALDMLSTVSLYQHMPQDPMVPQPHLSAQHHQAAPPPLHPQTHPHVVPQMPHPQHHVQHAVSSHDNFAISPIPVMSNTRTNLITVPIHDEGDYRANHPASYPGGTYSVTPPPPPPPPPPASYPQALHVQRPPPQQPYPSVSSIPPPHPPVSYTGTNINPYSTQGLAATVHVPANNVVSSHPHPAAPQGVRLGAPTAPALNQLTHPRPPPPRMAIPQTLPATNQPPPPPPRFASPHRHYDDAPIVPPFSQPGSPRMPWSGGPPPRGPHPRSGVAPPPQRPQAESAHYNQYY